MNLILLRAGVVGLVITTVGMAGYGTLIVTCTILDLKQALRQAKDEVEAWRALAAAPTCRPMNED